MTETTIAPSAGWYADPADPGQLRWWNGIGWTHDVRPTAPPAPPMPPVPAVEHAVPAPPPYEAFVTTTTWTGSPQTAGIWLLASTPTINLLVTVIVGSALAAAGSGVLPMETQTVAGIASLAVLPLAWVFAFLDRRALSRRGYEPPSILWMLLLPPLAYLIARGRAVRRAGGRAWPPELLYFVQVVGGILLGVGVIALGLLFARSTGVVGPDATPQYGAGIMTVQDRTVGPLPQQDELWIEASDALTADLAADLPQVYVDCGSSEPIVELGSTFPCLAFDLDDPAASDELSVTIDGDGVLSYSIVG